MRQDKVAQRKNTSRKNKEATIKVIQNISSSASPARSSSSCDSNENESMNRFREKIESCIQSKTFAQGPKIIPL